MRAGASVTPFCWFGHVTCKTVSEMTYNLSSGTLNSAILPPSDAFCLAHEPDVTLTYFDEGQCGELAWTSS